MPNFDINFFLPFLPFKAFCYYFILPIRSNKSLQLPLFLSTNILTLFYTQKGGRGRKKKFIDAVA